MNFLERIIKNSNVYPSDFIIGYGFDGLPRHLEVEWPLRNDSQRQKKMSRRIIIDYSRGLEHEYEQLSTKSQELMAAQITLNLRVHLAQFDADHNSYNPLPVRLYFDIDFANQIIFKQIK